MKQFIALLFVILSVPFYNSSFFGEKNASENGILLAGAAFALSGLSDVKRNNEGEAMEAKL